MRFLLDTSALLAHYRQEAGWEEVQALCEDDKAELIIASLSLTELGRRLRDLGATEQAVGEILSNYQLLLNEVAPVDAGVAKVAFTLGCRASRRLPLADALIAAVAQVWGATLVHRDEHMLAIPVELVAQRYLAG